MESDWKKIAEWAEINAQLEKLWSQGWDLAARRAEIEKGIPWLKNHGANPFTPPGAPLVPPSSSSAPPRSTILLSPPSDSGPKKKKSKTEAKISGLPVMRSPEKPEGSKLDLSQTFQGDPDKK
jgi:hypothetical protein